MSCKREDRKRHNTIAFWLSDEEKEVVEDRIKIAGVDKGEYYRAAVLGTMSTKVCKSFYSTSDFSLAL